MPKNEIQLRLGLDRLVLASFTRASHHADARVLRANEAKWALAELLRGPQRRRIISELREMLQLGMLDDQQVAEHALRSLRDWISPFVLLRLPRQQLSGSGRAARPPAVEYEADGPSEIDDQAYAAQFRAIDPSTAQPVARLRYEIQLENGATRQGHTDADGLTICVRTGSPQSARVFWYPEAVEEQLGEDFDEIDGC